jgi:hypothetical protein
VLSNRIDGSLQQCSRNSLSSELRQADLEPPTSLLHVEEGQKRLVRNQPRLLRVCQREARRKQRTAESDSPRWLLFCLLVRFVEEIKTQRASFCSVPCPTSVFSQVVFISCRNISTMTFFLDWELWAKMCFVRVPRYHHKILRSFF